jgi:guanyl-specific ribonuclease Sa
MALNITYWTESRYNPNVAGGILSNETLAVSSTSAQTSVTPSNAVIVSISSTETSPAAFDYSGSDPTASATTSALVLPGERLWIDAIPGNKIAGIIAD